MKPKVWLSRQLPYVDGDGVRREDLDVLGAFPVPGMDRPLAERQAAILAELTPEQAAAVAEHVAKGFRSRVIVIEPSHRAPEA